MSDAIVSVKVPELHTAGFPRSGYLIFKDYFDDWTPPGHVFNFESRCVRLSPEKPRWSLERLNPFFTRQPSSCESGYLVDNLTTVDSKPEFNDYVLIGLFLKSVDNETNQHGVSVSVGLRSERKPDAAIVSALRCFDPKNELCSDYVAAFTRTVYDREGALCSYWNRGLDLYAEDFENVVNSLRNGLELIGKLGFEFTMSKIDFTSEKTFVNMGALGRKPAVSNLKNYTVHHEGVRYTVHEESCEDLKNTFMRLCKALTPQNITPIFSNQDPKPVELSQSVRTMSPDEFTVLRKMKYQFKTDSPVHDIVKGYWNDYAKLEMGADIEWPFQHEGAYTQACVFLVERAIQNFTSDCRRIQWIRQMNDPSNIEISAKFHGKPDRDVEIKISFIYAPRRLAVPAEAPETHVEKVEGEWFAALPFNVPNP